MLATLRLDFTAVSSITWAETATMTADLIGRGIDEDWPTLIASRGLRGNPVGVGFDVD
jgi:hypothetical protein